MSLKRDWPWIVLLIAGPVAAFTAVTALNCNRSGGIPVVNIFAGVACAAPHAVKGKP